MIVQLGNPSPHHNLRVAVDPADYKADELRTMAEGQVDTSGTKEDIAARLSALDNFVPVPFEAYEGDEAITTINVPEGVSLGEAFTTITAPKGVWANHSAEPPSWVASDNDALATILASHFGDIEVRDLIIEESE